ncbi:secreted protein [Candidatus Magnetoovum chiemensis]|nr:secreted protein [Candidatus Magnetoovum chiemensis]
MKRLKILAIAILIIITAENVYSINNITTVIHNPRDYYMASYKSVLEVKISALVGINQVRCYFKTKGDGDYLFVYAKLVKPEVYTCTLPAADVDTEEVNYFFLILNGNRTITTTQKFALKEKYLIGSGDLGEFVEINDSKDKITVYSELSKKYSYVSDASAIYKFYDAVIKAPPVKDRIGFAVDSLYTAADRAQEGSFLRKQIRIFSVNETTAQFWDNGDCNCEDE